MLDVNQLQDQMDAFGAYQQKVRAQRAEQLEAAMEAMEACSEEWSAVKEAVRSASPRQLVAVMREVPDRTRRAPDRPTPITVVATDGSQIYPDRHLDPPCYLINVSRVGFQYGTTESPIMESTPDLHYGAEVLDEHFDEQMGAMTSEVVSALRDQEELRALLDVARAAQVEGRPLVALADGTLIRWMIRGMRNRSLEQELIARYTTMLVEFMEDRLPLASYISRPGNTEVMHLLEFYRTAYADEVAGPDVSLDGCMDRQLFARLLDPGERSAVFSSTSHIQREYPEGNRICYFYLHVPSPRGTGEIGRVEIPEWVAETPDLVDRIHGTVLSECDKGDGYPMILSEAHERAVVRGRDREMVYQMIERALQEAGLAPDASRKRHTKRQARI